MYETFVGVAFLIWLAGLVWFFISINSQFDRNLRKVSCRLSWLTLSPKAIEPDAPAPAWWKQILKFTLIQGLGLVSVLLGPVYVAYAVGMLAYARWKDSGAPASVKEVRWKLRNLDLSTEEVQALVETHLAAMQPNSK